MKTINLVCFGGVCKTPFRAISPLSLLTSCGGAEVILGKEAINLKETWLKLLWAFHSLDKEFFLHNNVYNGEDSFNIGAIPILRISNNKILHKGV